ncbi:MAG: hypothetical protein HXS44_08335 [Theionarchaea archaeon]|nr:hypothetical protein [Theionarchaea archaeon]
MLKDHITLETLITILRGKVFTGALAFKEGKILFIKGSVKLASYGNESGEFILDVVSSLPLPPGTQVIELSEDQVKLWLKWEELLYDEAEMFISPLPEVDRESLERLLEENELAYLLVPSKGD